MSDDERYELLRSLGDGEWARLGDEWFARPPGCPFAASLANHTVTEHDDGTITVSPSILYEVPGYTPSYHYHGFLEHGVWRSV